LRLRYNVILRVFTHFSQYMDVPKQIFKEYDIRGLVDSEITLELAELIGRAYATMLIRENPEKELMVAVGRDMRETSFSYQKSLIKGLTETGINVKDIGLVSTPAFYFSVGYLVADGGIMVSASHNPAAYNGFKMTRAKAIPVSGKTGIRSLAEMIEKNDFEPVQEKGELEVISGIPEKAIAAEFAYVGDGEIKPFNIVADSANGMGAQFLDLMFEKINGEATKMFWEFDGAFPNHEADPLKEENLRALQKKVKELNADIGISTDGDGDRIFFVDNEGEIVPAAVVRGLIAQAVLRKHPGATIGYDVRPGRITQDMIVEAGGKPKVTRVGHSLIKEQMREENIIFAGESSGHFYFSFEGGIYEGPVVVALTILQEMTHQKKTLSEIVKPLQEKYSHSGEINFEVKDKVSVLTALKEKYSDGKISELDGISVVYPDVWFNVRASNTENKIRLNLEAVNQEIMAAKRDEISNFIQKQ